ncbi:calmodulin-regulated spectrin-associated protein 1a isoform X2 [Gambusia affinis]|uniref:calmodulin-regulated spectrin-associated protein 1a isoform X2 n=1 Tax=Gambusia affinis TaxID=33528 RepID=UPI001CDC50ED|nr:calmodulin-regulated spectrin-associated protein 1a isoform X2 [Gambusia affinis]
MDVNAGRDSTWRRTTAVVAAAAADDDEDDGGGGGEEVGESMEAQVVQLKLYDCARAKIEANLRWVFAKAYGHDDIPSDLRDPFYTDQYEQEHIKPHIIHLLLSGELYNRVCGLILPAEQAAYLQSHQSVIQALSRKGIYVLETNGTPVSDIDLCSSPIKMSAHIHLIDALMMAYTVEMISIEKVVSCVKRFSNISASKELPCNLEEAMILWINKITIKMRELTDKECKMKQHLLESPSHHKVRYRRDHLSGRTLQHFPLVEDILKDVSDGTALLAVIHFYCPEVVKLEDICLKEVPSIADSMYNIQLLKEFSNEYLNKCFFLKPEDLLYSPPVLKNNVMVFIAELFWWFENVKPDFVCPRDLQDVKDVRVQLQPKNSRSYVPVSNVTKRSFMPSSNSLDILNTTSTNDQSATSTSSPSHSLLPLRQGQQNLVEKSTSDLRKRSNSMARTDGQCQDSIVAWPERRTRPLSQPVPYAVHFAKEDDADSNGLARTISKDSLASNIMSITPKHMLGSRLPQYRLSGQSLLSHMRIEDEEEEIEEEELVSVIHPSGFSRHRIGSDMEQDELEAQKLTLSARASDSSRAFCLDASPFALDSQTDCYYLEPLMPTIPKPAKEKGISLNKQEESGESCSRAVAVKTRTANIPFSSKKKLCAESPGFFLHLDVKPEKTPHTRMIEAGHDSDSDIADLEEDDEDDQRELEKTLRGNRLSEAYMAEFGDGEVESAKLREDLKVSEHEDKEDASGCSSPCPSTVSWASSCSASGSAGIKMTSFAERKLLKLGLRDGYSSTSSSQKTTPDGSEILSQWQAKEPSTMLGKNIMAGPVVPSELLQLHMQLEEQRRAIEYQKKKMEALNAKQRLKLGKAAFLNIVKKGGGRSDTLPLPMKHSLESPASTAAERRKAKTQACKDDSCLDSLKSLTDRWTTRDDSWNTLTQYNSSVPDFNECSNSIDLLNQAISSIQQQMLQLSLQQDLLMKQSVVSPPDEAQTEKSTDSGIDPNTPQTASSTSDSRSFAVHFVDIGGSTSMPFRRPPKLSSSQRSKAAERKQNKANNKSALTKSTKPLPGSDTSSRECNDGELETAGVQRVQRNSSFRVHESNGDGNMDSSDKLNSQDPPVITKTSGSASQDAEQVEEQTPNYNKQNVDDDESGRIRSQLIEIDLSLKDLVEDGGVDISDGTADGEQKGVLGFFFKDDEKAEDEMAKRRAAFLLKQQRKAEEARLRKQQQEAESEIKRDEARRKAEEERIRKEEEKARRELIKQEYLRRKQEALMEEQGLVKPRTKTKPRGNRPKSMHRGYSSSLPKGSTTRDSLKVSMLMKNQSSGAASRGADLSFSHRGSTLSLAMDADSVISGGADSNRAPSVCSVDSLPMLSRASSRNMDRDWENGSIASSITSVEYNGPKLFKEPSSKSNKPIIINAIAHCCLAGKVNEVQKNITLEELEKCDSNHLFILFRDGGCQFRAIYMYSPDTEVILKYTGIGPRAITPKMIDKLYKYNSDRKQFTVIPAKTVSVSVDALTIHNHLWQIKRPGSARRK